MKSDVNGCSTCPKGVEQYESYISQVGRKTYEMVQYDYRTEDGELFSCCAPSLDEARRRRDVWLTKR